jgi:hypothetical protein
LRVEHWLQLAIGFLTAGGTVGMTWGVIRGSLRGVERRLEQHITATSEWRQSMDSRVRDLTNIAMRGASRRV